jgi:calcineurin-like phosphoesterase family protein
VGDSPRVFVTADTHFGHAAILRLTGRPFKSLQAMDEGLISRWNSKVGPDDLVWHLGDFAYRAEASPESYRARLNGRIHLVMGNHDDAALRERSDLFESVSDIAELAWKGQRIALCHYPMRDWPGAFSGAWHLFGHEHGRLDKEPLGLSLDVGVDSHAFAPLALEEVARVMAKRKPHVGGREEEA